MRQVILDTETTGLEVERAHRIIEIGCVELVNRRPTSNRFHQYINPERDIDAGALAIHGISREQLASQPRFAEVAPRLLAFLEGAELIIHNASFDLGFLDAEFARLSLLDGAFSTGRPVIDSLGLARSLHPGQRNSLDALCKRYKVDNSRRELHGALLDAQLLAEVYLAMTGGQSALALGEQPTVAGASAAAANETAKKTSISRPLLKRNLGPLKVVEPTIAEREAHAALLKTIEKTAGKPPLWLQAPATPAGSVE
jgi:DNA polymerase-3 subunit epsilon